MSPCSLSQGHIIVTQPVQDISWRVLTALPQQCKKGTGPTAAQPTPAHKQNSSCPNEWTGSSWPLKRRDQESKLNHFNMSGSWSRNVCASRSRPPFGACPWSVLPPWFRTWLSWLSKTCKTGLTDSLAAMQIFILDWSKHFFTRQTCTQHATREGFPQLWSTCCWRISLSCSLAFLFNSSSKASVADLQAAKCWTIWPSLVHRWMHEWPSALLGSLDCPWEAAQSSSWQPEVLWHPWHSWVRAWWGPGCPSWETFRCQQLAASQTCHQQHQCAPMGSKPLGWEKGTRCYSCLFSASGRGNSTWPATWSNNKCTSSKNSWQTLQRMSTGVSTWE